LEKKKKTGYFASFLFFFAMRINRFFLTHHLVEEKTQKKTHESLFLFIYQQKK
jgi:hypothetical protein